MKGNLKSPFAHYVNHVTISTNTMIAKGQKFVQRERWKYVNTFAGDLT